MAPHGRQTDLIVLAVVPAFLSTLSVLFRAFRKVKQRPASVNKVGAFTAETLFVASLICAWLSGSFVLVSTYYGFGRHTVEIISQPGGQQTLVKVLFWQIMGYPFNLLCYSLSVAGQVMHYRTWLFRSVEGYKILGWIMNISGMAQVVFGGICIMSIFAQCSPVGKNWNPALPGTCWDSSIFLGFNYTASAITFVSYMIQAWVPIRFALGLENRSQLPRKQWAGLIVLGAWNVVAGALALIKIAYLRQYLIIEDATYRRVPLVLVGLAENGASGIVPSAAELWRFAQQLASRASHNHSNPRSSRRTHEDWKSNSDVELTPSNPDNSKEVWQSGNGLESTPRSSEHHSADDDLGRWPAVLTSGGIGKGRVD